MDKVLIDELFIKKYGQSHNEVRTFSAPGCVNFFGDYSGYCGGLVLSTPISMETAVAVRPRDDRIMTVSRTDSDAFAICSIDALDEYDPSLWGSYQFGVANELQKADYNLVGCDMLFCFSVPSRAGLASSASITTATVIALVTMSSAVTGEEQPLNVVELANIAQLARQNFIGTSFLVADYLVSSIGKAGQVLRLNASNYEYEMFPLSFLGYSVVLSNSGVETGMHIQKSIERREECDAGLELVRILLPELVSLCELSYDEFLQHKSVISDNIIKKRVEHVVTENERAKKAVDYIKSNNVEEFGKLMTESHISIKDFFDATCDEIDILFDAASNAPGSVGSRMTGAGFGGCLVSIVKSSEVDNFIRHVSDEFTKVNGKKAEFYVEPIA